MTNLTICNNIGVDFNSHHTNSNKDYKNLSIITTNDNVASIDDKGDMYLRGIAVQSQTSLSPTTNSFIVTNSSNDVIVYFNSTGSILLLGTINQTSLLNVLTTTNFEFRNSSNDLVAVLDNKGSLHLQGRYVEGYESP